MWKTFSHASANLPFILIKHLPCHVIKKKLFLWILFRTTPSIKKALMVALSILRLSRACQQWWWYVLELLHKSSVKKLSIMFNLSLVCSFHSHHQRGKSQYFMLNGSFVHAFCFSLSLSYHDMAKPYFSPLNQQSIY